MFQEAGRTRLRWKPGSKFTDGKVNIKGNLVSREPAKKADYILYINANNPIAIVEAKDNHHSVSYGLQQAMAYAQMMDIPFAYSSNGDAFYEHDFLTGLERQVPLDQFPTYDELYERFKAEANGGSGLSPRRNRNNRPAILHQPEHLCTEILSAYSYQPYCGRDRKGPRQTSSRNGYRYWKNIYGFSDRISSFESWIKEKDPVSRRS